MGMKQVKKGFTLIELLVVISIIALLISIMMPALNIAREQAKTTTCAVNQRSMGLALRMYEDSNDQLLPPHYVEAGLKVNPDIKLTYDIDEYERGVPDHNWNTYIAYIGSSDNKKPVQLGKVHANNLIDESELFYCPSQGFKKSRHFGEAYYTHDYYVVNNVWALNSPGKVRLNYNYWLHGKKTFDELHGKPVMFDMIHHWYSIPHVRHNTPRGVNVLYGDGHVAFATNPNIFDYNLWNGGPSCSQLQGPGHHLNLFEDILKMLEQQPY